MPGRTAMYNCASVSAAQKYLATHEETKWVSRGPESENIFSSGDKMMNRIENVSVLKELTFQWRLQTH